MSTAPDGAKDHSVQQIKFHHGLGDTLMFRNILSLLDLPVELYLNPSLGQKGIFHNDPLVRVIEEPENPKSFKEVRFDMENSRPCAGGMPTKARICMEHEFGLVRPDLKIRPLPLNNHEDMDTESTRQTAEFLEGLGRYVLCHFQGTWSPDSQNPEEGFAERTVASILERGYGAVIINYNYLFHNPQNNDYAFIDGDRVRSTYNRLPMEFDSLLYLLRRAELFIGVVSGPLHAALCINIPVICLEKHTRLIGDLYDCEIEDTAMVKILEHDRVPSAILDDHLKKE